MRSRKTKIKVTTVVYKKNGKYHKKSMRTRSENKLTTSSAGKRE